MAYKKGPPPLLKRYMKGGAFLIAGAFLKWNAPDTAHFGEEAAILKFFALEVLHDPLINWRLLKTDPDQEQPQANPQPGSKISKTPNLFKTIVS